MDSPSGVEPDTHATAYRAGYDDLWEKGRSNNPYSREHEPASFTAYQAGSDEAAHDLRFWYGF